LEYWASLLAQTSCLPNLFVPSIDQKCEGIFAVSSTSLHGMRWSRRAGMIAYTVSKAAVAALTEALAQSSTRAFW
jgi:NAD(P)-dependent dehydrogenase (short-subunit alcohol dehydrogenase family)